MKWLFKISIFIILLLTAVSSQHLLSPTKLKSTPFLSLNHKQNDLNHARVSPVIPVRDTRVFQIAEDEEDNISSRGKKATQYASFILMFLGAGALLSIFQSLIKNQPDNRLLTFSSQQRYIQLCTIRI